MSLKKTGGKFWQHIKHNTIKNKIYKTLTALKDAVAKFLNSMSSEEISSVCAAGYLSSYFW